MKRILICLLLLAMLIPTAIGETECDVNAAIEALKACWRDEAYGFAPEGSDGYLEIKNTRVVTISDAPKAAEESAQAVADELFGDVDCIVEFVLYSDLLGCAPYYQEAESWNCVVIYKDGTMAVPAEHPFEIYQSRAYSLNLSGIIDGVTDLNQDYNAVYTLLAE